ncbi:hypothetical protein SOCE26_103170 [Sorangium cellulosum]|uniref:Uncharacterized protein n=1 Tax=Sorangium cellulosum TaxID=56 RepID=A0A2L0FAZ5_SORCE|nr:hypothetical protein [Sorangium cellulosum]AUX48776.1 hypothetical protein SOCE26_103170 [Sorangium cellulosum]
MDGAARVLAWFTEALARHQPEDALSFSESQARFIAVLTGLIAVERGGGMLFGMILSGEHTDALVRAALPALTASVDAHRASFERRFGARGRKEVARIAADLRYEPLIERRALRADPAVEEALAQLIDTCIDPDRAAPWAGAPDPVLADGRISPTLRGALTRARAAPAAKRVRSSVAVKPIAGDRPREVAELEAKREPLHPQIEALYAAIDGLALLDPDPLPSRVPWPAAFPGTGILLVAPLAWSSVLRKTSRGAEGTSELVTIARLPDHMLPRGRETDRGHDVEYTVSFFLAYRTGTAEIYLTDDRYGVPPLQLAEDLVSFLRALRGAAAPVENVLDELARELGGGSPGARGPR